MPRGPALAGPAAAGRGVCRPGRIAREACVKWRSPGGTTATGCLRRSWPDWMTRRCWASSGCCRRPASGVEVGGRGVASASLFRDPGRGTAPRNSTSSPSRCAGPPASPPPCTRAPWKASARPPGLVARGRCLYCVPSSCISALPGTTWRPLTEPASYYPWSVLWRATDTSHHVHAIVSCAQTMSRRLSWLVSPEQTVH